MIPFFSAGHSSKKMSGQYSVEISGTEKKKKKGTIKHSRAPHLADTATLANGFSDLIFKTMAFQSMCFTCEEEACVHLLQE